MQIGSDATSSMWLQNIWLKCPIPRNTQKIDFQQYWECQDKLYPVEAWVPSASISKTDKLRRASGNYKVQVLAQAHIMVFSFAIACSSSLC